MTTQRRCPFDGNFFDGARCGACGRLVEDMDQVNWKPAAVAVGKPAQPDDEGYYVECACFHPGAVHDLLLAGPRSRGKCQLCPCVKFDPTRSRRTISGKQEPATFDNATYDNSKWGP